MNAIHTEMRYFQRRLDDTLAMADAAAGPCSRKAHELLARLYGETLDALATRFAAATVELSPALAFRGTRVTSRVLRPAPPRERLTLKLAC